MRCEDLGGKRRRDHFRRVVVPMLKSPSRSLVAAEEAAAKDEGKEAGEGVPGYAGTATAMEVAPPGRKRDREDPFLGNRDELVAEIATLSHLD